MPRYRKLAVKSVDSLDLNDMPDDFARLMWTLLPLKCCREGRGLDIPQWIKAQLFPLRSDVTLEQVESSFGVYQELGMIERYVVSGRPYFQVVNWIKYQGNTTKEAESPYPGPEVADEIQSNSGASPELLQTNSITDAVFNIQYSDADADADAPQPSTPYHEIRKAWKEQFPDKPLPRKGNKTLTKKAKTRMESQHFREHWQKALVRAGQSSFLRSGKWFTLGWFLQNDDNYEKCLDGNYDDSISPNGSVAEPAGFAAGRKILEDIENGRT